MFVLPRFSPQSITKWKKLIRIEYAGVALPIIFIENTEDAAWEIPTHPVDSNMKISDTIWNTPAAISLTGYVARNKYDNMMQMISSTINASGLYTVYLLGKVYNNMQFESISKISNSDNVTGYKLEITMKEILKVTPSMSIITEAQAKISQDATVQELGQSTAQNMSNNKTVLKTIKDSGIGLNNIVGGIL